MVKEKRILSYFLGWLIVGFCIIFVGVNNVFAAEYYLNYDTYQRYYDNTGTLTEVNSSWNDSLQSYISGNLTTVNGSTGAAWLVSSPIPMVKGHQYSISFAFVERNNIALSSKNKIAVSNTVNGAVTAYNNSSYNAETIYSKVTSNTTLSFVFKANSNSSFIVIPFTTTSRVTQNYTVTMFVMEDLGTAGLSQEELNTTINNQTNILNNSIQNSTDTITGEIDDMEQSIIDSNKETQDVIKDQFNDCRPSVNLLDKNSFQLGSVYYYYMYLDNPNELYTLSIKLKENGTPKNIYIGFSENNLPPISNYTWLLNNGEIQGATGNDNFKYIRNYSLDIYRKYVIIYLNNYTMDDLFDNYYIQLQKGMFTQYEEYGEEICTNKIDETNDQLGNINDALTDSSPTDMSGLSNSAGWLPAGPVDSILTLPLTMLNNLVNNLSTDSCQQATLELPYVNKNINLPCIKTLYEKIGITGTLFQSAGLITSAFILFNYLLKLYQWVDATLTMRENTMPGYFDDNWGGGA